MMCMFYYFLTVYYFLSVLIITSTNGQKVPDDISEAIKQIYLSDSDRARPRDIVLSYQQHSNSPRKTDSSQERLFKFVSPSLTELPVYKKFSALFDNYVPHTGFREIDNSTEIKEIDDFLLYVFNTVVFKKTFEFLKLKRDQNAINETDFKTFFRQLWFGQYSRKGGVLDTSSFEHVFIGEILRGQNTTEIGGLHNWFRFYHLEKSGLADYAGFVIRRRNLIAMVQFDWLNVWKPSGSFIIGSSPQFDMCAYTICFLLKPGFKSCQFELDGCLVSVTSHKLIQNRRTFIGTAYPSPGPACGYK